MILENTAEGIASGTSPTTGNSGGTSGDAFDAVTVGTSGTSLLTADSAAALHGARGYRIANSATTAGVFGTWSTSLGGSKSRLFGRLYFRTDVIGTGTSQRTVRFLSGGVVACAIVLTLSSATPRVQFAGGAGGNVLLTGTSSAFIAINTWYRIEYDMRFGALGTAIFEARIFRGANLEGTTPDETLNVGTSVADSNSLTSVDEVRIGNTSGGVPSSNFDFDSINVNDTGYPGPFSPDVWPPVDNPPAPPLRVTRSNLRLT